MDKQNPDLGIANPLQLTKPCSPVVGIDCQSRSLFDESKMTSNTEFEATEDQSAANAYEEDFM